MHKTSMQPVASVRRTVSAPEEPISDREQSRQENFVPLHTTDLVDFLAQHPALRGGEAVDFRHLASLILALLHHVYRQRHEQLTYLYAPLDPDRDTLLMSVPLASQREQLVEQMFQRLDDMLHRANYRQLSREEISQAMAAASRWGVRMRVDFDSLQNIEVYARGNVVAQKHFRSWRTMYRLRSVEVHLYQRLVVVFRTQPSDSDARFDWRKLYLRMFKNIPQQDVDMVLPATKVRLSWLDHSTIVLPSLYALASGLWRALRLAVLLTLAGLLKTAALVVLVIAAFLYGIKSMFTSTLNTRRRYYLNVAQNLYYQSLDNNAGAMLRLLEEGEQQEACESVLTYFAAAVLLRERSEVTLRQIDAACEDLVWQATGVHVNFDIENAVRDLVHLGLIRAHGQYWSALPLADANRQLNATWDQWFNE